MKGESMQSMKMACLNGRKEINTKIQHCGDVFVLIAQIDIQLVNPSLQAKQSFIGSKRSIRSKT